MSWFSSAINRFFNRRSLEIAFKLFVKVLGAFAGKVGANLADEARIEVGKAEASGMSGTRKFEMVFNILKNRFKDKQEITDRLIRAAIEISVEHADPKIPPYMR